jgi:hypothetical protein
MGSFCTALSSPCPEPAQIGSWHPLERLFAAPYKTGFHNDAESAAFVQLVPYLSLGRDHFVTVLGRSLIARARMSAALPHPGCRFPDGSIHVSLLENFRCSKSNPVKHIGYFCKPEAQSKKVNPYLVPLLRILLKRRLASLVLRIT